MCAARAPPLLLSLEPALPPAPGRWPLSALLILQWPSQARARRVAPDRRPAGQRFVARAEGRQADYPPGGSPVRGRHRPSDHHARPATASFTPARPARPGCRPGRQAAVAVVNESCTRCTRSVWVYITRLCLLCLPVRAYRPDGKPCSAMWGRVSPHSGLSMSVCLRCDQSWKWILGIRCATWPLRSGHGAWWPGSWYGKAVHDAL